MSDRLSFNKLRQLAQIRILWRRAARGLADVLPKGLYKRSLLIVIVPMVLLQSAVTLVFMQHHWDLVTRRLSEAVARDVGALLIEAYTLATLNLRQAARAVFDAGAGIEGNIAKLFGAEHAQRVAEQLVQALDDRQLVDCATRKRL